MINPGYELACTPSVAMLHEAAPLHVSTRHVQGYIPAIKQDIAFPCLVPCALAMLQPHIEVPLQPPLEVAVHPRSLPASGASAKKHGVHCEHP